jgi:hypothetical protein
MLSRADAEASIAEAGAHAAVSPLRRRSTGVRAHAALPSLACCLGGLLRPATCMALLVDSRQD